MVYLVMSKDNTIIYVKMFPNLADSTDDSIHKKITIEINVLM